MSGAPISTVPGSVKKRPRGGSRKGIPNKVTRTVKEAVEHAFQQVGGADYLAGLAITEPRAFVALVSKLIPNNISVDGGLKIEHLFTAEQLRRMADEQERAR